MSVSPYNESIQKKTMPDVPQKNTQKFYKDEVIIKKNPQRPNYRINFLNLPIKRWKILCFFHLGFLWFLSSSVFSKALIPLQCFHTSAVFAVRLPLSWWSQDQPPNPDFPCSLPGNKGLTGTSWVETWIILERVPVKTLVHALCSAAPYWCCTNMHTDNDAFQIGDGDLLGFFVESSILPSDSSCKQ